MRLLNAISEESPNVTPNSERLSHTTSWTDDIQRMLYNTSAIAEHPPQLLKVLISVFSIQQHFSFTLR